MTKLQMGLLNDISFHDLLVLFVLFYFLFVCFVEIRTYICDGSLKVNFWAKFYNDDLV